VTQYQQQPYDASLKTFLDEQIAELLSLFLPRARFIGELPTEIFKMQAQLRMDKVYEMFYRGEPHIVHFELETSSNSRMAHRMLKYHALLLEKYDRPVISLIIYPFQTSVPKPPLIVRSGKRKILIFHFRVLALWELEAQRYIQDHTLVMYPLLPTMQGANLPLLRQAIKEMQEYYKGDALSRRLIWFRILLERVKTISQDDKAIIKKELRMFDELLEGSEYIQEIKKRAVEQAAPEIEIRALEQAGRDIVNIGLQQYAQVFQ
jgi:hypothetical protein